jgi:hypothetical protein
MFNTQILPWLLSGGAKKVLKLEVANFATALNLHTRRQTRVSST